MKVLVCDDDEIVLKVAEVALQRENAEVTVARDGRQAMKHLKGDTQFDLIITDIHMPYHNGDQILQLVREEQQKNTPIIMLSSDGEEEVIALALKQGVNDFIVKPVDAVKLMKKIKKFLK
jgi:DNA-binding response OmpR family regulator